MILKTLHSTGLESLVLVQFKTEVTPVIMGNDISFLGLSSFFQSFFWVHKAGDGPDLRHL